MDIAIVTPTLNYGGGERQVEFLASGLAGSGHSVRVYCFFDDGPIAYRLAGKGIKVHRLYNRAVTGAGPGKKVGAPAEDTGVFRKSGDTVDRLRRLANECLAALKLFAAFAKKRPDVVHLYQNQTKMAVLAGRMAGVKRIVYTETSLIGDWLSPSQLSVMRFFWRRCDAIIALSESMKRHMVALGAAVTGKVYVVPTMLPSPGKNEIKPVEGKRDVTVGIVGRLTPEKGHVFFLKAAELINKQRSNIKFIIAGQGYLKNELSVLIEKNGLAANTELTGAFKDISDIMCRIDILVLSSLTEGAPLVLLEGMAYGKPVVAANVGGVSELVVEGKTGFLVAPKDPEALADAILKLAGDTQMRKRFAEAAINRFTERYSSGKLIPEIESIYRGGTN
ncbi:MAG: glycosyltransferase family 4 protein [Candidatus Omnitrophota bacterium]|jgi:glycosyltransferase involved in cell wall biosynthesis